MTIKKMRGFIDPITLGAILAVLGTVGVLGSTGSLPGQKPTEAKSAVVQPTANSPAEQGSTQQQPTK